MPDKGKYYEGKVLWFNAERGYGFIERPQDSDLYVHYTDIAVIKNITFKRLYAGQDVRYRIALGPRGEYAYNVFPSRRWFVYKSEKRTAKRKNKKYMN